MQLHEGRGRRPKVDYIISIDNSEGVTIRLLLVEVKHQRSENQLPQLAAYASKVSTCNIYSIKVLYGAVFLLNWFFLDHGRAVSFTTNSILHSSNNLARYKTTPRYRIRSDFVIERSALVELRQALEGPSIDTQMKEVTDVLYTTPYCPPVPKMVSSQTLANVVQELDKEKMHDKNKELEQKMHNKDKEMEQNIQDKDEELAQKWQ